MGYRCNVIEEKLGKRDNLHVVSFSDEIALWQACIRYAVLNHLIQV